MICLEQVADTRNAVSFLAARPEVYELIRGNVEQVNRDLANDPHMSSSQVRRFLILPKELDAEQALQEPADRLDVGGEQHAQNHASKGSDAADGEAGQQETAQDRALSRAHGAQDRDVFTSPGDRRKERMDDRQHRHRRQNRGEHEWEVTLTTEAHDIARLQWLFDIVEQRSGDATHVVGNRFAS